MIDQVEISKLCLAATENIRQNGRIDLPLNERPVFASHAKLGKMEDKPVYLVCQPEEADTISYFRIKKKSECPELAEDSLYEPETLIIEEMLGDNKHDLFIVGNQLSKYEPYQKVWLGSAGYAYPSVDKFSQLNQIVDAFQKKNIKQ